MELEQLPGLFFHHHACQWLASVRVTSHWASSGIVVGREKVTLFQGPFIPARTENYHLQLTLSVQVSSWLHAHTFFTWIRLQVNSQWPISRVRSKWGVSRGKGRNSVHEKANSFNLSLSDSQMMGAAGEKILVFQHSSNGKYNLSKFDTNFGTAFVAFFMPKSVCKAFIALWQ